MADIWTRRLAECRRNLGSRTGEFWRENRAYLELPKLPWYGPGDDLHVLWRDQELLYSRGEIQQAALVFGHGGLRRRAWLGGAAILVHGPESEPKQDQPTFVEIARHLNELRGTEPTDPDLARVLAAIEPHERREMHVRLPDSLTGGRECYVSEVFLHRDHMPNRWLAGEEFPILCLPKETQACALLPSRYWPADLTREWSVDPPPERCPDHDTWVVPGYGWPTPVIGFGSLFGADVATRLVTGDEHAFATLRWPIGVAFAVAGVLLSAWDKRDRAAKGPRYFAPVCGHVITPVFDRKFVGLTPRVWSYVAFALAIAFVVAGWVR